MKCKQPLQLCRPVGVNGCTFQPRQGLLERRVGLEASAPTCAPCTPARQAVAIEKLLMVTSTRQPDAQLPPPPSLATLGGVNVNPKSPYLDGRPPQVWGGAACPDWWWAAGCAPAQA